MKKSHQKIKKPVSIKLTGFSFATGTDAGIVNLKISLQNESDRPMIGHVIRLGHIRGGQFEPLVDVGAGLARLEAHAVATLHFRVPADGFAKVAKLKKSAMMEIGMTDSSMNDHMDYAPINWSDGDGQDEGGDQDDGD